MSRNYNTTLGLPYSRIASVHIDYGTERIVVNFTRGEAVVVGGSVRKLEGEPEHHSFALALDPAALAANIHPMRDYATGEPTGGTISEAAAIVGFLSVLRAKELEIDAGASA